MSLFDYSCCKSCKFSQDRKKDVLLDVLPVDICCKVSEFFGCWKCEWMKEKEEEMFNRYIDKDNTYTKPELQILFFRLFNKSILLEPVMCHEREMKKEIDRLFDNEKVRDRFSSKVYLQAIKSYCKKDLRQISAMVFYCYDLKIFKEIFSEFLHERCHIYRNEEYPLYILVRPFLIEYIRDQIGINKQYCDIKGISDHINNLVD